MNDNQIQKLRGYYDSLSTWSQVLDEASLNRINRLQFCTVVDKLHSLEKDFPGVIPSFTNSFRDVDFIKPNTSDSWPNASDGYIFILRSYLAVALGKLENLLDTTEKTPVTEVREFLFVKNFKIRAILERDYQEIQRAYIARCWKSIIILAGAR